MFWKLYRYKWAINKTIFKNTEKTVSKNSYPMRGHFPVMTTNILSFFFFFNLVYLWSQVWNIFKHEIIHLMINTPTSSQWPLCQISLYSVSLNVPNSNSWIQQIHSVEVRNKYHSVTMKLLMERERNPKNQQVGNHWFTYK